MPFGASKQLSIGRNYSVRPYQVYPNNGCKLDNFTKKFGSTSLFFDGVNDRANLQHTGVDLRHTGEFTWECWFYPTNNGMPLIYYAGGNGLFPNGNMYLRHNTVLRLMFDGEAAAEVLAHQTSITLSTWNHAALTRNSSNVMRLWLNGVQSTSGYTRSGTLPTSNTGFALGNRPANDLSYDYGGYLDEIRISNICRYTANFTPATEPFTNDANTLLLLHCEGTSGDTGMLQDDA